MSISCTPGTVLADCQPSAPPVARATPASPAANTVPGASYKCSSGTGCVRELGREDVARPMNGIIQTWMRPSPKPSTTGACFRPREPQPSREEKKKVISHCLTVIGPPRSPIYWGDRWQLEPRHLRRCPSPPREMAFPHVASPPLPLGDVFIQ